MGGVPYPPRPEGHHAGVLCRESERAKGNVKASGGVFMDLRTPLWPEIKMMECCIRQRLNDKGHVTDLRRDKNEPIRDGNI
jgi:hypothetical protein